MKNKHAGQNFVFIVGGIVTLLFITIGVSFAYFTATITGAETGTTLTVSGGTMEITFAGGSVITANNIAPGDAIPVKTFTVSGNNTTGATMKYSLALEVVGNTFAASALKYTMTSTNTGSNGTPVPAISTAQNIAAGARSIALGDGNFTGPTGGNKVHTYGLQITFPETGGDQNVNKGKQFTAYVKVEAIN